MRRFAHACFCIACVLHIFEDGRMLDLTCLLQRARSRLLYIFECHVDDEFLRANSLGHAITQQNDVPTFGTGMLCSR